MSSLSRKSDLESLEATMNKGQLLGLGINFLGLILFVVWFVFRNRLPTALSIIFAVSFLGILIVSIFIMLRSTQKSNNKES
jgi:preprotein translocase subunit SecF